MFHRSFLCALHDRIGTGAIGGRRVHGHQFPTIFCALVDGVHQSNEQLIVHNLVLPNRDRSSRGTRCAAAGQQRPANDRKNQVFEQAGIFHGIQCPLTARLTCHSFAKFGGVRCRLTVIVIHL